MTTIQWQGSGSDFRSDNVLAGGLPRFRIWMAKRREGVMDADERVRPHPDRPRWCGLRDCLTHRVSYYSTIQLAKSAAQRILAAAARRADAPEIA